MTEQDGLSPDRDEAAPPAQAEMPLEELSRQPSLPSFDEPAAEAVADQEFLIPVHHFAAFTVREVKIIDHPAFQRLFTIQQLGQTNLVYRGATHKRGEHALGAVAAAAALIESLAKNSASTRGATALSEWTKGPALTPDEDAFARLAALLHDVGHIVAGHTLEDELGLLPPHDGDERFRFVLDRETWGGRTIPVGPVEETLRTTIDRLYEHEADRIRLTVNGGDALRPSEILIRLVSREGPPERYASASRFRLNVIRDIVGNTICADLLDYLHRDWERIGKPRFFDTRLLQYFELRERGQESHVAVNLQSNKPGRYRPDAITAILDLLESRYQLWEVALLHRTKTGAASMLERAVAELADALGYFGNGERAQVVEGVLLEALFETSDQDVHRALSELSDRSGFAEELGAAARVPEVSRELLWRLRYRVLHKQVEVVGAHESDHGEGISERLAPWGADRRRKLDAAMVRLMSLRELEADFGFDPGSLSMYCAPYGMGGKLAEVRVLHRNLVRPLHEADRHRELTGGHLDAQLQRFDRLWRAALFASPESIEWLKDHELMDALALAFQRGVLGVTNSATSMRNVAEALSARAGSPHFGRGLRPNEVVSARGAEAGAYPSGMPTARAYFE